MPIDEQKLRVVLDAINAKVSPRPLNCPVTGDANWQLESLIALLPATEAPSSIGILSGPRFPLALLNCQTCGYTMMFNLVTLGLSDLFDMKVVED